MAKQKYSKIPSAAGLYGLVAFFLIFSGIIGCGDESGPPPGCSPGASVSCECTGASGDGVQVCLDDGVAYGECLCDTDEEKTERIGPERDEAEEQIAPEEQDAVDVPAMTVTSTELDFGIVASGTSRSLAVTILSTGVVPLKIQGIEITDEAEEFGVDLTNIEGLEGAPDLSEDIAFFIEPGDSATFDLVFTPKHGTLTDEDGHPIPRVGLLHIIAEGIENPAVISFSGVTSNPGCPSPVIILDEAQQVTPGTTLHLRGNESFSDNGWVEEWIWEVNQPDGSFSAFEPGADAPGVKLDVNVVGEYFIRLKVEDWSGSLNCQVAEMKVVVVPETRIHVELVWDTPGDVEQFDVGAEKGTDLDLHFLHPNAVGLGDGWYDDVYDCFWSNPSPASWVSGPDDVKVAGPELIRDDKDGWGPEMVAYDPPDEDQVYKVGIHKFKEHGFGPSIATVRVYIDKEMALEISSPDLEENAMWEVFTISWPSGEVEVIDGGQKVYEYVNPFFYSP